MWTTLADTKLMSDDISAPHAGRPLANAAPLVSMVTARRTIRSFKAAAYHEAGHAVAADRHGIEVRSITIVPTPDYVGRTTQHVPRSFFRKVEYGTISRAEIEAQLLVSYAGPEAEKRFAGRYNRLGARPDFESVRLLLSHSADSPEEAKAWATLQRIRACAFVKSAWKDIETVALALLDRRTLTGEDMQAILLDERCSVREVERAIVELIAGDSPELRFNASASDNFADLRRLMALGMEAARGADGLIAPARAG
jgi:hypothetical protein